MLNYITWKFISFYRLGNLSVWSFFSIVLLFSNSSKNEKHWFWQNSRYQRAWFGIVACVLACVQLRVCVCVCEFEWVCVFVCVRACVCISMYGLGGRRGGRGQSTVFSNFRVLLLYQLIKDYQFYLISLVRFIDIIRIY